MKETGHINNLIDTLAEEHEACQPLRHPFVRVFPWALGVVIYMAIIVFTLGLRGDIAARMQDFTFVFEVGLSALIMLSATFASGWLSVPDARGRKCFCIVPLASTAVFLAWSAYRFFTEPYLAGDIHWDHCLEGGTLVAIPPAVALVLSMRRGATTQPLLMAGMNILSVAGLSYIIMRMVCQADSVFHAAAVQVLPFFLTGAIMIAVARKLYHW